MTKTMNNRLPLLLLALLASAAGAFAAEQSTAFSYQGRLLDGGAPATGLYDFQFTLFDAASAGNAVGSPLVKDDVPVTNGLFTAELDFGPGIFAGQARWLAMGARAGTNTGGFLTLPMRQALNSVPQSQYALVAGSVASGAVTAGMIANNAVTTAKLQDGAVIAAKLADGAVTEPKLDATLSSSLARLGGAQTFSGANNFSAAGNTFTGSGAGLTALNAASLASGTVPDARFSANVPLLDRAAQTFTGNAYFTPTSGGVGIGTTSPGDVLGIRGANATMRIFDSAGSANAADGFIGQSSGLLQLGLFGTEDVGTPPFNIPTPYKRSFLAMDTNGAVGTLERSFGLASSVADYRITLDDGAGLMKFGNRNGQMLNFWGTDYGVGVQNNTLYQRSVGNFAWYRGGQHSNTELDSGGTAALMTLTQNGDLSVPGNVLMKNIVGLNFKQGGNRSSYDPTDIFTFPEDQEQTLDEITVRAPAAGFIFVSAQARLEFNYFEVTGVIANLDFKLYDVTGATPSLLQFRRVIQRDGPDIVTHTFTAAWIIQVGNASDVRIRTTAQGGDGTSRNFEIRLYEHNLTAIYIPVRHGPVPP